MVMKLDQLTNKWERISYRLIEQIRVWTHRYVGGSCRSCGLGIKNPRLTKQWCDCCILQFAPFYKCQQCGIPLIEPSKKSKELNVCGACLAHPKHWHELYYVAEYQTPMSSYIHELKFEKRVGIAKDLSWLLLKRVKQPAPIILPVPIHWRRYLKRGFNQSYLLARYFVQHLNHGGLAYGNQQWQVLNAFQKVRASHTQKGLTKKQRQRNLAGTFQLNKKYIKQLQDAKHVAIFDDVFTTGSTVESLCDLLLEIGVKRVDIYCICRTPEPAKTKVGAQK
jgi:ComF family protein